MIATQAEQQLEELHNLILMEREYAKQLDLPALEATVHEKNSLLSRIPNIPESEITSHLRELAQAIREDNQHNAYLFWTSLAWVRDSIEFFNSQCSQKSYGGKGQATVKQQGGQLLSGKV